MERPDDEATARAERQAAQIREATSRAAERCAAAARKMTECRETARRLAADVAGTETRLAATLRDLADRAARQGRHTDAERLNGEAEAAEQFAEVERRRSLER